MNAHPLHSIGVEVLCEVCEKKRQTTKMTMEKLKMRMRDLSEIVGRLKDDDDEKSTADKTVTGEVSLVEEP
ncbi:hypothetical protein EG329_014344 [Mollisiaceae sp. DMI_Dod_QoI]|nr:hypothetical protein EG329_014344 [Helotiales sp. DMI_Dod_QoI]